jgi:hypothetical protein
VTIGDKPIRECEVEKDVPEDDKAEALFKEQAKRANDAIEKIKRLKLPKVGKIWEIRKEVLGGKKACQESTAIVHPISGELVVARRKIKEVSLEYCTDTLRNNVPQGVFKEFIQSKIEKVRRRLKEEDGNGVIEEETFHIVLAKFQKSGKRNYDFLVKAGKKFQAIVFQFCQEMIQKETFPHSFRDTTLHMIFKGGKGRRHDLSANRFIHSKPWWPRLAEGLSVEEGLKQPLVEGSSVYQIGGQPGHRSEEHVFVLKSVIARQRAQGKPIIIQPSDIQKYFDKEMIEDVYLTSLKRGADPKFVRLW